MKLLLLVGIAAIAGITALRPVLAGPASGRFEVVEVGPGVVKIVFHVSREAEPDVLAVYQEALRQVGERYSLDGDIPDPYLGIGCLAWMGGGCKPYMKTAVFIKIKTKQ